jgi:N-acyl-L-homoserine lactone synthetase
METLVCTKKDMPAELAATAFLDRGRQFVDRLGWNLCVSPGGVEKDEYDDEQSIYLAVHQDGKHLGSCRVRSSKLSTMVTDHFCVEFPEAQRFIAMQKGRVFELTRFCRAPHISVDESRLMLDRLAILLDKFRDQNGLTGFVAVVFPQVARFLDTIGVRYLVVSKSKMNGKTVLLICITHAERVPVPQISPCGKSAATNFGQGFISSMRPMPVAA